MANHEQQNNDLERQEEQQNDRIKSSLLNFGKDEEQDKKFLENPKSGENSVKAIKEDIVEKSKSLNDQNSQAKIDKKLKGLEKYTKLGKLSQEQAQELSEIYKEIESIEGTEVKENNIQGEKSKEVQQQAQKSYSQKLLDAVERLDKFLSGNHEKQQEKIKNDIGTAMLARKNQKEPPSAYANLEIPTPQKESPNSLA